MAALEKTDWQSKILLELAFFMNGFPESTDVSWRVIRPTMNAYRAAVELVTGLDATYVPWPRDLTNTCVWSVRVRHKRDK